MRWEGDTRGEGVADAEEVADGAAELADTMRVPRWVAEEPDVHLLPHLERACASLPFELVSAGMREDGSYDVRVRWTRGDGGAGEIREAVFALVGSVAELSTYVRQRGPTFEVVTGFVPGESQFAPHGHVLRIEVER